MLGRLPNRMFWEVLLAISRSEDVPGESELVSSSPTFIVGTEKRNPRRLTSIAAVHTTNTHLHTWTITHTHTHTHTFVCRRLRHLGLDKRKVFVGIYANKSRPRIFACWTQFFVGFGFHRPGVAQRRGSCHAKLNETNAGWACESVPDKSHRLRGTAGPTSEQTNPSVRLGRRDGSANTHYHFSDSRPADSEHESAAHMKT